MTTTRTGETWPIRVVIIDNAVAFGGTLTVVRNLVSHLDPKKVQVTIVTACTEVFIHGDLPDCAAIVVRGAYANYLRLQDWKRAVRRRFGSNILGKLLERLTITIAIAMNVPYMLSLAYQIKRTRAHLVQINNPALEPFWVTRLLGVPTILHLHGLLPSPMARSIQKGLWHIDAYIAISRCVRDAAMRAGVPERRIHHIPNFVQRSPVSRALPLPIAPTIGIFGRVIPWKGQKEFLAAIRIVLNRFPDARGLVVGGAADGNPAYMDECKRLVHDWGLSERIEFTGMVSDVTPLYRRCSIVVHASIEPEPFGMVLIEAMAEGRPIVASTLGAAAEIITDDNCGLLADPRNAEELAEKISTLIADRELAEEMGKRGLHGVLRRYNPEVVARDFERLYESMVHH